mmetsp:Transcript_1630/g.2756  ORF Transcript_1630/g.2756 Transcript_1630/m.2756 type:complete len:86 (-) Transcript_1630:44-301(-)
MCTSQMCPSTHAKSSHQMKKFVMLAHSIPNPPRACHESVGRLRSEKVHPGHELEEDGTNRSRAENLEAQSATQSGKLKVEEMLES